MRIRNKITLALFSLVFLLMLGLSNAAQAQGCQPTDCACIRQQHQAATANALNQKLQNASVGLSLYQMVDAEAETCWIGIRGMFGTLTAKSIIGGIVTALVMGFVTQVCAAITSDLSQLKTYVLSQLNSLICLPNLGSLGLGGSLGLQNAHCPSGTFPVLSIGMSASPSYNYRTLIQHAQ